MHPEYQELLSDMQSRLMSVDYIYIDTDLVIECLDYQTEWLHEQNNRLEDWNKTSVLSPHSLLLNFPELQANLAALPKYDLNRTIDQFFQWLAECQFKIKDLDSDEIIFTDRTMDLSDIIAGHILLKEYYFSQTRIKQ